MRTASERLCRTYALDTDTPTELKAKHDDAFNVEAVTKEFYTEYKTILDKIDEELQSQGIGDKKTAKGFAQQFLNRLMFLYFIQKRGWLNNDRRFVWSLVKQYKRASGTQQGIYSDWFEPLFFYSFNNKEISDSYDNLPADLSEIYKKMPYLNGGLFLMNDLDKMGYRLDDALIYKIVDIDGSGLLERYNFTIREDTPFDVDVAVDPEMLGKVYESLIQEEERGKVGIFYTPRIEVDFMCRQSLLEYVIEHTGISHGKLISFIYAPEGDRADLLSEEEAQKIGNALYNAQIVDPACGSGAFLVGMLHVLMELYSQILKRLNKRLNPFKTKKEIISNNLYGADIKDWAVRVAELRMWLTLLVETPDSEIKLNAKKPLLPNLTLKLRCGDSLVQEIAGKPLSLREYMIYLHPICKTGIADLYKELREDKKRYYYSRADDPDVLARIKRKEVKIIRTLVDSEIKRIDFLLKPLAATQQRLDSAQTAITTSEKKRTEDKLKLEHEKERLNNLLETLKSGELRNKFFWEIDFAEVFADGGFDIVIANPPYVRQEKIAPQDIPEEEITKELRQEYKAALVRSVTAQWGNEFKKDLKSDLYVYFYYLALSLLKPRGVFCFISSNSWLDVGFGAKLQAFLLRNIETKAIYDNHAKRTFAEADINTIIVVFKRPKEKVLTENLTRFVAFKKPFEVVIDEGNLKAIADAGEKLKTDDFRCVTHTQGELWKEGVAGEETKQAEITGSEFIGKYTGNKWGGKYLRAPDIFFTILEKGKGKLVRLGDIAEVRRGFTTGANEFFYLQVLGDGGKKGSVRVKNDAGWEGELEKEFLKPVIKNPRESKNILLKLNNLKYKVIMCHKDTRELEKTKILDYIDWGEKQQYHKRPTCAGRQKWWDLGNWRPADCFWMESINDINRVYQNPSNTLLESDKFYGIIFKNRDLSKKYSLFLNSTLYCLFRELKGFTGMGEGVLKLPVYDVKNILILTPDKSSLIDSKKLLDREINSLFEECSIDPNKPIREREPNPLPDRAELDNIVFDELGLTEEERKEVYWAVCELVKQRLEKARSLKRR
ncbi:MAG: Eco57I restriction-modification methylase domain-containing protein [Methanophagales archaeon]|nr:Eco57I restriction-modification methylase domain-containing protein [Methanophagales archaeon]